MTPKSELESKFEKDKKASDEANHNPLNFLGGLFSSFFNPGSGLPNFVKDFAPSLEKVGQTFCEICKDFAQGKITIEPLDIFKAISDLIKAFCNFIAESFTKKEEQTETTQTQPLQQLAKRAAASHATDKTTPARPRARLATSSSDAPGDSKPNLEKAALQAAAEARAAALERAKREDAGMSSGAGLGFSDLGKKAMAGSGGSGLAPVSEVHAEPSTSPELSGSEHRRASAGL